MIKNAKVCCVFYICQYVNRVHNNENKQTNKSRHAHIEKRATQLADYWVVMGGLGVLTQKTKKGNRQNVAMSRWTI